MESLRGHLLVATPELGDPNFSRTVVLILKHDGDGAFGIVLNRPSDKTIQEVWQQLTHEPCDGENKVHLGGPVAGPLIAVHTCEAASNIHIVPGVHVAMEKEKLGQVIARQAHPCKFFVGCAGWSEGQLERELEAGAWLTTPATAEYLLHVDDDLWKKVAGDIASSTIISSLNIKHVPRDPSMN